MSKSIAISIPIHEQSLVVANQLENIKKFVPNSIVVLHASADSPSQFRNDIEILTKTQFKDFAFLNPAAYHTYSANDAGNVTGLSTVHASNFQYINSIQNFDLFGIETSNDMFVRMGVEYIHNNYDCACNDTRDDVNAWKAKHWTIDELICKMEKFMPINFIKKDATESCFYSREVFSEVSRVILGISNFLAGEELFVHTIAHNVDPNMKNLGERYVFHNPDHAATRKEDIDAVRSGQMQNKYVVKRVPRNMSDWTRKYVNEITAND